GGAMAVSGLVAKITGIAGITGISLTQWLTDTVKALIALGAFVLLLAFCGYRLYLVSDHLLKEHYPKGYLPLSSTAKFTTSDGKTFVYELWRHIQVKRPALRKFEHRFEWSGTKVPLVRSDLQSVSPVADIPGETAKQVDLTFSQTRVYNEVEVVHILMDLDDSDGVSQPYLRQRVEAPIRLIAFDVELLHAPKQYNGEHAKLCRKSIEKGQSAVEQSLATVPFNAMTKSFAFQLHNPEPGFDYIFSWEKPPLASAARRRGDKKAWAA
ncbi:MAG: hypothetical protein JWP36_1127, partial [Paucimonas sp.]|nr:hypothetical protein [Paucimonas sp.]